MYIKVDEKCSSNILDRINLAFELFDKLSNKCFLSKLHIKKDALVLYQDGFRVFDVGMIQQNLMDGLGGNKFVKE